eukprot:scaffold135280_cov36-Prasinocladus_malaysianus.AAC.1
MKACLVVGIEPYGKWAARYRKHSRHAKIESGQPYHFVFVRQLRGDVESRPRLRHAFDVYPMTIHRAGSS